jgi:hypothetical protein
MASILLKRLRSTGMNTINQMPLVNQWLMRQAVS